MRKLFFLAPLIVLTISSCDLITDKDTNTAVDTLNAALRKLETNSDRWQDVLKETRDKLIQQGQSTLANEVSNILSLAVRDIRVEAQCYTDFLRDRVEQDLIKLRAPLTKEKLQLNPVFCNPTPNEINMNLPPDRRTKINIGGYNLTRNSIRVYLVDLEDRKLDVSDSLDNPDSYSLTVTPDRIPLNENSKRLIFELPDGKSHSISIIKAYKPPKEEFSSSRIHITGTINMNDKEYIVSDQNKNVRVDTYVDVPSGGNTTYHWEDCVGDEVQGYLDVQMQLNKETGVVSVQGAARYYEGTRCGETDLQETRSREFTISPGKVGVLQENLKDDDGGVNYNLTFANEDVKKVLIP